MKNLILVGGGGHCKSVIDVAESVGYTILGILDKPEEVGMCVLDHKVIGTDADMLKFADAAEFIVTVGQIKSPDTRIKLHQMLKDAGCRLATIIAPTAHVSKYAVLGEGTVVMHNAVVNSNARVGDGCIINTSSVIEHDVVVGDYCHVSTGAIINGGTKVGKGSFVGSQSVINQGVSVGANVIIGSGSVVTNSLPDCCVACGVPARPIIK